jgi:hypothetical protein
MIFSFKRSREGERDRVVSDFDMDELNDEDVASGTESDTEQPEGGHRRLSRVAIHLYLVNAHYFVLVLGQTRLTISWQCTPSYSPFFLQFFRLSL